MARRMDAHPYAPAVGHREPRHGEELTVAEPRPRPLLGLSARTPVAAGAVGMQRGQEPEGGIGGLRHSLVKAGPRCPATAC